MDMCLFSLLFMTSSTNETERPVVPGSNHFLCQVATNSSGEDLGRVRHPGDRGCTSLSGGTALAS